MRNRSIAVLAANPAFASILGHALEDSGDYRVPVFSTLDGLSTFLRIAPVDIAVLDIDLPWTEIAATARALKAAPRLANPLLEIVVLTRAVPIGNALAGTSIAAVLGKPVAPARLIECIESLLEADARPRPAPRHVPAPRAPRIAPAPAAVVERHGNVIPLFGNRQSPRP